MGFNSPLCAGFRYPNSRELPYLSRNFSFERISSFQCYELTRRYSHLHFTQISLLTYATYLWSLHCECATKHNRQRIFNYLQIRDTMIDTMIDNFVLAMWEDPGFPPLRGGTPTYDFAKLHCTKFINFRAVGVGGGGQGGWSRQGH